MYTDGENVSITPGPAPEGKVFDHWETKSDTEGVKDSKVNISSKTDWTINLLVGDCDCTITPVYRDEKTIKIDIYDATGQEIAETVNAPANSDSWVSAPAASSGYVFDHWETSDTEAMQDVNSRGTFINTAESNIELYPQYVKSENPTFDVVVENGSGSGSYVCDDEVELIADPPQDGYMFYKWENVDNQGLSTGIAMDNEYCYKTKFKMVDRFASLAEGMYDEGTQVVFGGGNPLSDSIFLAASNFDYPVYAFGSGYDEGDKGNCLASVVNDYGAAIKLALADYQGGAIFSGDCSNNCIYVTGKNLDEFQLDENGDIAKDKDGNEIKNEDYNQNYATIYKALAENKLNLVSVQSGTDVRAAYKSACLTLNYKIK
ncbi:MAG: InlB B-repeat-containing protein [Eubacterium sp.]|nr:InlB B-repeat-containing protein [Eubacterium sp.]